MESLFKFGIITDTQYADIDDGYNFGGTQQRFYRKALTCLEEAVKCWNDEKMNFVLQLGDMIDGKSIRNGKRDHDVINFSNVFKSFKGDYFVGCCGNHELYNFKRSEFIKSPFFPKLEVISTSAYEISKMYTNKALASAQLCAYHFSPHKGFRFIVLDCYDISQLGREKDDWRYQKAEAILNEKNPNSDKNASPIAWKLEICEIQRSCKYGPIEMA